MKIEIEILNPELSRPELSRDTTYATDKDLECRGTWHSRRKTYESDQLDDDMKSCTVSHYVDRVTIDNAQLTTKSSVQDLIEFLTNAKESFKY